MLDVKERCGRHVIKYRQKIIWKINKLMTSLLNFVDFCLLSQLEHQNKFFLIITFTTYAYFHSDNDALSRNLLTENPIKFCFTVKILMGHLSITYALQGGSGVGRKLTLHIFRIYSRMFLCTGVVGLKFFFFLM